MGTELRRARETVASLQRMPTALRHISVSMPQIETSATELT